MHYRNGREAKNGDQVMQIPGSGMSPAIGILIDAQAGNDYCNGTIVVRASSSGVFGAVGACLIDCLHVDDVVAMLAEKGLDKRPAGK